MLIEVGQHRAHVKHLEDEVNKVERELNSANRAKQSLRDEVTILKTRVEGLEKDKKEIKERLRKDTDEHRIRVRDLYDRLNKAHTTIKVQGGYIQASKEGIKPGSTPHRHSHQQGSISLGGYEDMAAPYFDLPSNISYAQTAAYHNQPSEDNQFTLQRRHSQRSNPWEGEDNPTTLSTNPWTGAAYNRRPGILPAPPGLVPNPQYQVEEPSYQPSAGSQTYYTVQQSRVNLTPPLIRLFANAEEWAKLYANVPDKAKDTCLPQDIQAQLFEATNPAAAASLLSTSQTRYFAITKLLLHMMVNFAFQPMVVKGFRPEYDFRMLYERQRIHTGVASHIRRSATMNIAEIVREICRDPDWPDFLARTTHHQCTRLWHYLQPLFAPDINRQEAWHGLFYLWEESIRIGQVMFSTTSLWTVDFPPVGESSSFNPANMTSRDPEFDQDSRTLGQMGLKVKLAITPVVTEANVEISGSLVPRNLCFANVLLMR